MLNPEQNSAVKYINGPLLVLAGAGSGKTKVITEKITYLIQDCQYKARHITAVTFTNKAANEMRARISQNLSQEAKHGLTIATFHALCLKIIKRNLPECSLHQGFSIFDSSDCLQLIREFTPKPSQDKDFLKQIQQQISNWKNNLILPHAVEITEHNEINAAARKIYPLYQEILNSYNAIDFDDIILKAISLLQKHQPILDFWQQKIKHLLIDEYQDTNYSQYILFKLLTQYAEKFTVVGDDDQSIYAWRGASSENLSRLQQDYPKLKVIKLEQNYRSSANILKAANDLIINNPHIFVKKLWSSFGTGDFIKIIGCNDENDEAEKIVAEIINNKFRHNAKYKDFAILYRGNHQARVFETVLRSHGIAYTISGGQSWFAKTEIKDIFAYLRLITNNKDDAAFIRAITTPKRGIGEASIKTLMHYAKAKNQSLYECSDHLALSTQIDPKPRAELYNFKAWLEELKDKLAQEYNEETLHEMLKDSGYEEYIYTQTENANKAQKQIANILDLFSWITNLLKKKEGASITDIINHLILIDILETAEQDNLDAVHLSTLHAAKGLEFKHVYIIGMEEDILPHKTSIEQNQIEEERRLAYVGITRAERTLCLSYTKMRRRLGEVSKTVPSRFLQELPQDIIEWISKEDAAPDPEKSKKIAAAHLSGLKELLRPVD
jgi:ATP-dependent DNA helicase Rep